VLDRADTRGGGCTGLLDSCVVGCWVTLQPRDIDQLLQQGIVSAQLMPRNGTEIGALNGPGMEFARRLRVLAAVAYCRSAGSIARG
jgi:hypothetical protein